MFEDVYLVDDELSLASHEAVTSLEDRLGFALPAGYREFVTRFGNGAYCNQLYVLMPEEVEECTRNLERSLSEFFFWDKATHILSRSQVAKSIQLGHSLDGDEVIFNPDTEYGLYVLPSHDDTIYWMPQLFRDPLDWRAEWGNPLSGFEFRYFEPEHGREHASLLTTRTDLQESQIASAINTSLSPGEEVRQLVGDFFRVLFHRPVGSRVQITWSLDRRIGINIGYNPKSKATVNGCIRELESIGFYRVGGKS